MKPVDTTPGEPEPKLSKALSSLSLILTVLYIVAFAGLALCTATPLQNHLPTWFRPGLSVTTFYVLLGLALSSILAPIVRYRLFGSRQPSFEPDTLWFAESGASIASWMPGLHWPVQDCHHIDINITDSELWTRVGGIPGWFYDGREWGLENRIPLGSIISLSPGGFLGNAVVIEWRNAKGGKSKIRLWVRDRSGLIAALERGNPGVKMARGWWQRQGPRNVSGSA